MLDLLAHVIFASSFTLWIKWAQQRSTADVVTIGAINYIVAALCLLPFFWAQNPAPVSGAALVTGSSMGAVYFVAFFFAIFSIRTVGAASTTVVSVLSILMPIGVAAVWYDERPTLYQSLGIGLALVSLLLIGGSRSRTPRHGPGVLTPPQTPAAGYQVAAPPPPWLVPLVLVGFFLLCGLSRVSQEAFKYVSQPDQRPAFLVGAFLTAAIPSATVLVGKWRRPRRIEWGVGLAMGVANALQTLFLLRALEHLAGYIAFTLASGGAILLTTIVATACLGERLNRRTQMGISLAVVALVLLRWLPPG